MIKTSINSGEMPYEHWKCYFEIKNGAKYADNKITYMHNQKEFHRGIDKKAKEKLSGGKRK